MDSVGFDLEKYNDALFGDDGTTKEATAAWGKKSSRWPFCQPKNFDLGTYQIRLAPIEPTKNPDGMIVVWYHEVVTKRGERGEKFLCRRQKRESCVVCDFVEQAATHKQKLNADTVEALEGSWAKGGNGILQQRTAYYPILVLDGELYEERPEGKDYTLVKIRPAAGSEVGVIWELRAIHMNDGWKNSIAEGIGHLMQSTPHLNHHKQGRYINWVHAAMKGPKTYAFKGCGEPEPIRHPDLIKDYPDLITILGKWNKEYTFAEQKQALLAAWWAGHSLLKPILEGLGERPKVIVEDSDPFAALEKPAPARQTYAPQDPFFGMDFGEEDIPF